MTGRGEASKKGLALLCAGAVCAGGCFQRTPRASVANLVSLQRPVVPAAVGADFAAPPNIELDVPEAPELVTVRSVPTRPRVIATPVAGPTKLGKEPEPSIAPEVSGAETDEAKVETQQNLDSIERNLTAASGKSLNATQQDLASKVRGFAENAREAIRTGDWLRAKNLSKKAEVLSEELASSL
jgi:hypothetical protein